MIDWTDFFVSFVVAAVAFFIVDLIWEVWKHKQVEERRRAFREGYKYAKQETEERKETKT